VSGGGAVRSRVGVNWLGLGRTLGTGTAVSSLGMALRHDGPHPSLVHHSDRGVRYSCRIHGFTEAAWRPNQMIRKGNPYDNAACDSFMKS